MNNGGLNLLLADSILIVHFIFVLFVVVGFLCIIFGRFIGWPWIYYRLFRMIHLVAIGFVVTQSYLGQICPLTIWENDLRAPAGQEAYTESFIQYWLQYFLYYEADPWLFGVAYTVFAVLILTVLVMDWKKIN
jgi:hypothetical protein